MTEPRGEATSRTFVAVFPPEAVLRELRTLRETLTPHLAGLRWAAPQNLHFTLRFFGDLTADQIAHAAEVMDVVVPGAPRFELGLHGVGVFSGWRSPRVFWVGAADGSETLEKLARALELRFREVRLGKADKPFKAHLTLGRWRDTAGLDPEHARAQCVRVGSIARFEVGAVHLMKSTLAPGGSIYESMHEVKLA